jgi:hypothetical protein
MAHESMLYTANTSFADDRSHQAKRGRHASKNAYIDNSWTRSTLHQHFTNHLHRPPIYQDLHYIKPDYINLNINVKLYDYIKL